MRHALLFLMTLAVALALAAPAEAQFARASVAGTVSDPDGAPLPGVTVTVRNEDSGLMRTAVTSGSGGYIIQGLVPGTYTVTFAIEGFRPVERPGVELRIGQQGAIDANLELSAVTETLTVTAASPMIEVSSKEVGGSLAANEIEDLPSINRSFILFASLIPGVVAAEGTSTISADVIFVNGQDDQVNQFNIDGAANDDQFNGGNAGGQVRAAFDAMQEFQVLTSQFDAEFGRSTGAVVNAVTKSGGNEIHGTGFAYRQNNSWNSIPFFTERQGREPPKVTFAGVGGTVGGPIVADRTHYFVSFEYLQPNEAVVNDFSEVRPERSFSTAESNNTYNLVAKVDHQLNPDHKMALRWLWEYQPQFNQGLGSDTIEENLGAERDTDQGIVGSLDTVVSNTTFNNLRISFTRENVNFTNMRIFETCFSASGQELYDCQAGLDPLLNYPDIEEGASTRGSKRIDNSLQFDETLSTYISSDRWGDHDLRIGGNFWRRHVEQMNVGTANGVFDFPENPSFDINDTATYPERFAIRVFGAQGQFPEHEVDPTNVFGLFLQDDWQPIPNLTLNLGLRYDWETITNDSDNIGPRVGISWDPVGDGQTIVRGGWGRFYTPYRSGLFDSQFTDSVLQVRGITVSFPNNDNQQAFIDLIQQNGFTNLLQVRDFLKAQLENELLNEADFNSSPTVDWPFRIAPHTDNLTFGVERVVANNLSIGFDYVRLSNRNMLQSVDLNDFSRTQGRPNISILNGETPSFGSITTRVNEGETDYNALQVSVVKRQSPTRVGTLGGRISYTLSRLRGDSNNDFPDSPYFQTFAMTGWNFDTGEPINPGGLDLGLDHPQNVDRPGGRDRRHNFVLSGNWTVPGTSWRDNGGVVLAGIFRYLTGGRTTITINERLDNNNFAVAPAGTYNPNNPNDISLSDVEFEGTLQGASLPSRTNVDFSLRYRLPFTDTIEATVLLDAFNLFNSVYFRNIGSTRTNLSGFLVPSSAFPNREIQIGVRLNY